MTPEEILRLIMMFLQDQVFRFNIADVPPIIFGWMREHPGQTVFHIANGILIFTPAALTGPLLASMGWGAAGPTAGKCRPFLPADLDLILIS